MQIESISHKFDYGLTYFSPKTLLGYIKNHILCTLNNMISLTEAFIAAQGKIGPVNFLCFLMPQKPSCGNEICFSGRKQISFPTNSKTFEWQDSFPYAPMVSSLPPPQALYCNH